MRTFKTLDELHEYNNKAFKQVFGSIKYQRPQNPFEKNSWDALKFNARPHDVFKLDWSSYSSLDFADRFLPYIKNGYKGEAMWMYDGAELFNVLRKADQKLFKFDDNKYLISLINYTYPKGVLAESKKDIVRVTEHEVLTFIGVDEYNDIEISFKFGRRFKSYLNATFKDSKQSVNINTLEEKTYSTDISTFKNHFNNELVHYNMMSFIFKTLGIEELTSEFENYNKLFSPKVIEFMNNFYIADKYKVEVFIKKTQTEVYEAIDDTTNPNRVFPPPDSIYIWLVSEDFINYDTPFIRIQFGTNVAKDLKLKNITVDYLEDFVLNKIKDELEQNIYSKEAIDASTKKGLATSLLRLGIQEDLASDKVLKDVFETNPGLYMSIKAADFLVKDIESLKFKEKHWNPRIKDFEPAFNIDTKNNAIYCGIINGLIDAVKSIPELAKLVSTLIGSDEEWEKFKEGIDKLLSDEATQKALIEAITKDYKDSFDTGNIEKLFYTMAHDTIAIISLLVGLYGLVKGVAGFINFIGKALKYIRRYGIKSIKKLKKLKPKQLKDTFDEFDKANVGTGGFLKYKKVISRNVLKQEHANSCGAACIRQLAKDKKINISEKKVREIARTDIETGTQADGMTDAMIDIFGKNNLEIKMKYDPNISDIDMIRQIASDNKPWVAWISPTPSTSARKHTIIIDKVVGNNVFIRDPWPLEAIDEASFLLSKNGVEGIVDLNEFAKQWAYGLNYMFKLK